MRGRRVGAMVVITGGIADIVRILLTQFAFPLVAASPVIVAVVHLTPTLLTAVGAVAVGMSYRARGRLAFLIAGSFGLLLVAVNAAQISLGSPLGPAPSQFAIAANVAATIAGAALLLTDRSVHTPERWALALPAGCTLLAVLSMALLPLAGLAALAALPAVGYIFGGFLVLRTTRARSGRSGALPAEPLSPRDAAGRFTKEGVGGV